MNGDEVAMKGRELLIAVQGHCVENLVTKDKIVELLYVLINRAYKYLLH